MLLYILLLLLLLLLLLYAGGRLITIRHEETISLLSDGEE